MKAITYLIVESEIKSRYTLLQKIDMCQIDGLTCVGLASNADEGLWFVRKNHPDIILIDINLPGKNGFECLESIKSENYDPEIIFTSAYVENEYLLKALKKGPVNYLTKPIDIDELSASFEKAISRVRLKQNQVHAAGKIKLSGGKEVLYLKPDKIAYCKADGHYTNIFLTNGKLEMISQSIGSVEKDLPPNVFFRIDRSSLLNISVIESIDLKKQTCMIRDGEFNMNIEISTAGLKRLLSRLDRVAST